MPAIFFTTEFKPDADSGSLRLCYLLQLLRESYCGVELVLMMDDGISTEGEALLDQMDVRWWIAATSRKSEMQRLGRHAPGDDTLVVISRPQAAVRWMESVRRLLPRARLLYDTVDLHHVRLFRQAKVTRNGAALRHALEYKRVELQACMQADVTLVVSNAERELLVAAGIDSVEVVSNIHKVADSVAGHQGRNGLLFIGSFLHHPNVDAALYLGREVYPEIQLRCPGIELYLVGGNAPAQVRDLAGDQVHVTGHVEDVEPLFNASLACIAPLRYGAGVKGKVSRSLSVGLPVVATPTAAEGMPLHHGESVLIGKDAGELAACVARLVADSDLWSNLSRNGLAIASRCYSLDAARRGLERALSSH